MILTTNALLSPQIPRPSEKYFPVKNAPAYLTNNSNSEQKKIMTSTSEFSLFQRSENFVIHSIVQ